MKKNLILASLTLLLSIGAISASIFLNNKKTAEKADAYSVSSLPTTIDLNDTSEANIRSYYSSLNNLSTSERQGTNLLKNLKPILKNGQKYLSYDGNTASTGKAIWDVYCIVDRDWTKSPASALPAAAGTYNSSTNKITGYKWGGNTSTYENPYLHALYYNRDKTAIAQAYGDHNNNTSTGINREHIWPKGAGFDEDGSGGARGDVMHLWAANGHTNNIHSNNFYGYVDTSKSYTDIGATSTYSMCAGNLSGKSKTFSGSSNTVFEPQDSDKGDIARACFYMVARYNYLSGSDSDGIDSNNPNLELVNNVTDFQSSGYTSSTSTKGKLGILQDLLEWNRLDPPDEFEIHRNNLCYNNFTNNRNPFIDFPVWAEYIWGKSEDGSYNSSSTGYATPSSDTINGYNDTPISTKTLTSISISGQTTSFKVGDTFAFGGTVTAHYDDSTTANVTSSSTFSGYNMSNAGNQTVTVSYTENNVTKTTSYQITVEEGTIPTPPADGDATLYSGALAEGDYVIVYGDGAMKNVVSSNRLSYEEVSISDDVISSPSSNIIWHIAPSGDYWTIYNSEVGKYAASNGTKNQAQLLSSGSDNMSLWTVSGTSTYEFVNKNNASASVNANLRRNTSYGFACYASGTGGALSLYKVSEQPATPTSISATVNKTFYVGETISGTDISVKDNNNQSITDFNFANNNYQFTYEDASSGGALTNKTFTNAITYGELGCSLTVQVQRKAYVAPNGSTATFTGSQFKSAGIKTSYTANQTATVNGVTFKVSGYIYSDTNLSLSNGKTSAPGSVYNTSPFSTGITGVSVTGATPDIQLSIDGSSWDDLSECTTSTVNYNYFKLFYKNTTVSNYVNITQIVVNLKGSETALNVANYLMYEDTNNQCVTKLNPAIALFENMTTTERSTFMNSDDYVISTARERLEAWATNQGKSIVSSGGDYVVSSSQNRAFKNNIDDYVLIFIILGVLNVSIVFAYFYTKKKRNEK